jgi:DnaJ-class molecular chaperone
MYRYSAARGPARDVQTSVQITLKEVQEGVNKSIHIPGTVTVDPRTGGGAVHSELC